MRLACLHVPEFALAALLRVHVELRGESVAVVDTEGARARVVAVSPAAARHGVRIGMSAAQAAAVDAALVRKTVAVSVLRAAQAALCDAAESFSPRVEEAGEGIVYLDLQGLGALYESESQLAHALLRRAATLGLDACVGVGGSKVAAALAARQGHGVVVIPPGEEWSFLAPLPVALLEPSQRLAATLSRWGIRTVGDLAALPANAIGARLGPEGTLLLHRARGEDEHALLPRALPLCFEESVELEYGMATVEPFLFVLRPALERLTARLALRGLISGDLRLSLKLTTRSRDDRTITVAAPSNDVKVLLALVRLHLETYPPPAAIEELRISVVPERLRAAQLDLFRPNGPAPAKLAVTLARLTAICGADHVGRPVVADSHRPDAYGVQPFSSKSADTATLPDGNAARSEGPGGARRTPPHTTTSDLESPASPLPLALRAIRPPRPVEVFCERDRPEFVRGEGIAGRVVYLAGPWRIHGDWWNDGVYSHDYYDAQLSDGCVYRLCRDTTTREWSVGGVYD